MAKKAKSIVTLSLPKWRKRLYCMLYFICPKTASGSMGRLERCLSPEKSRRPSERMKYTSQPHECSQAPTIMLIVWICKNVPTTYRKSTAIGNGVSFHSNR